MKTVPTGPNSIGSSHSSEDGVQRLRIVNGITNSWRSGSTPISSMTEDTSKDQPRPPTYNPEDYAAALKKFTKRIPPPTDANSTTENGDINGSGGEMSLRQFSSASDLLNKLKTDLRVAYPSFVQEFVGDQIDGVNLLLELLKCIQATQSHQQGRAPPPVLRRSLIDENACLLCLLHCLRCQDAAARCLATSSVGLYSLAVSTMSNVTKSRITSLQLLTKTCESTDSNGHKQVSEAMSTLRLKFGEPVRFQFLIGMIIGSNVDLITSGLKFLNTFIRTAPNMQTKLYIQAEIVQAGLNIDLVRKACQNSDFVKQEINTWEKNFIDLEQMKKSDEDVKQENLALREKVAFLERKVQKLHEEKSALINVENQWKEKYNKLLEKKQVQRGNSNKSNLINNHVEDEGISSSELEDDIKRHYSSNEDINRKGSLKIINEIRKNEDKEEYKTEEEEKEIIPTKLLPSPPRKYIINYCNHDDEEDFENNQPITGFFDDDDEISENSNNYYCTQNKLINNKTEANLGGFIIDNNKTAKQNNIQKTSIIINGHDNNKAHDNSSSSSGDNFSNSDDSNCSFSYYIQNTNINTNKYKITNTTTPPTSIETNNTKKIIQKSDSTPGSTTNIKINSTKHSHGSHGGSVKDNIKQTTPTSSSGDINNIYKNMIYNSNRNKKIENNKNNKENDNIYNNNIILKRRDTFHNVGYNNDSNNKTYQNVEHSTTNINTKPIIQNIIQKPKRNLIKNDSNKSNETKNTYEDTQSDKIKQKFNDQYNIRRSSFDGLFYITSNVTNDTSKMIANGNRNSNFEQNTKPNGVVDNVNMINSNYFNYVNIKFNSNNSNTSSGSNNSGNNKKYKSLEGITDGLESMVDIVMTNNGNSNSSSSRADDIKRGNIYKNIRYDKKNSSLCKLSDLPSGLY